PLSVRTSIQLLSKSKDETLYSSTLRRSSRHWHDHGRHCEHSRLSERLCDGVWRRHGHRCEQALCRAAVSTRLQSDALWRAVAKQFPLLGRGCAWDQEEALRHAVQKPAPEAHVPNQEVSLYEDSKSK